jgi:cytidine deaminase
MRKIRERPTLKSAPACGWLRQRIAEFSDRNTRIILLDDAGLPRSYTVKQLLPASFRLQ